MPITVNKKNPVILPSPLTLTLSIEKQMRAWLEIEVRKNLLSNIRSKKYFKTHPTGQLANSFQTIVKQQGSSVYGFLFSNLRYAGIHEYGGVIKPVNAKALTIPTKFVKTPASKVKGSARDFQNTFIKKYKRKDGSQGAGIFQQKGDGIIPLFWLVKKVELKGKHYVSDAIDRSADFNPDLGEL